MTATSVSAYPLPADRAAVEPRRLDVLDCALVILVLLGLYSGVALQIS